MSYEIKKEGQATDFSACPFWHPRLGGITENKNRQAVFVSLLLNNFYYNFSAATALFI
jgi:hypothetical protein